jgi:hypothetical protein
MTTKAMSTGISRKNIIRIILVTLLILAVPLVAMQFTNEVNWDVTDFVVMGALLLSVGLGYILAVSKVRSGKYRLLLAGLFLVVLFLIWAELAVGLFGTPFTGQ